MSVERLTEDEWRQREARRECDRSGHDWDVIQTMGGPVALRCGRRCGDPGYTLVRPTDPAPVVWSDCTCGHPVDDHNADGCAFLGCGCSR